MRERRFGVRPHQMVVLVAGLVVALYAVWVIRHVGSSPPAGAAVPAPRATPTATARATAAPKAPPSLRTFRTAVADARTILVIGDSTGDGPGEWVDLWAQDLGGSREVTLHNWEVGAQDFSASPLVYGFGQALDLWNLSSPDIGADPAQQLGSVPTTPGAVILNVGHDRDPSSLRRTIRTTTAAIADRWGEVPCAWVLQNPATQDADRQEAAVDVVRALATKQRVPVIDVHRAFRRADDLGALLADGTRPSPTGSRLWADTMRTLSTQ